MEKEQENVETPINTYNKPKKTIKVFLIIISSILIVALLLGSFILGRNFAKLESNKNKTEEKAPTKKPNNQEKLYLYIDEYENLSVTKEDESDEVFYTISVTSKDAKIYDYRTNKKNDGSIENIELELSFVLYEDEGLKLLDVAKNTTTDVTIDTEYDNYLLHLSYDLKTAYGIIYNNYEDKSEEEMYRPRIDYGYYNLSTKQKMYDNQYQSIVPMDGIYLKGSTESEDVTSDDYDAYRSHLLKYDEEKEVHQITGMCDWYSNTKEYNDKNYVIAASGCTGLSNYTVYDNNFKEIYFGDESGFAFHEDGTISTVKDNKIEKYDIDGNKLSTSKSYQQVLHVFADYFVYLKNNEIYIEDKDGAIKVGDWKEEYYYHYAISGIYDEKQINEEEKNDYGLYLVFEYNGIDEGPGFEIYYNPETREIKKYELEFVGGYAKPVLYLYPEEKTDIKVNFEKEDNLTTTYPKFKDEWQVTAYPNGDLYDKEGKYYYALYWEEDSNHTIDFTEGFYVSKDNAIEFLEEKLSIIGLNDKEKNEFIMYWLPIIESNEHNLIYFELTEERDSYNKLEITPKPDSLLRMAIHVKKIDKKQTIKEQKLTSFERTGFTAVEWGGVLYK